jgi:serine/threonine-protein kinase
MKIITKDRAKTLGWVLLFLLGSSLIGILAFNYIALPLWVGRYEEISVPDLCGKELEEAKEILSDLNLKARVEAQKFSTVPRGIIISQHPLPVRRVKKGKTISVCLSRGQEKVQIPWVQGLLLPQAQNLLRISGLNIREVIEEDSDEIPNDEVIRSEPAADVLVLRGADITLYVSQGLTDFRIPDFTWKTVREVEAEANRLGLILIKEYAAEPSPLGVVIAQMPLPGTPSKSGKELKVIVGAPR